MTAFRARGDAATDRGLHLGDGVFETVLVSGGRPCLLAEHLDRMGRSARALGLAEPDGLAAWVGATTPELWTEEGRPAKAALRVVLTRGTWRGLEPRADDPPSVFLALRALPDVPPMALAAVVLDAPRLDPASPLAGHKTLSWMGHVEARRRARAAGADVAFLRTIDGDVAESDAASLFVVRDGALVTPPLDRGILPGITRARVLAAAASAGVPASERRLESRDVGAADEVFVASSLAGAVGVRRVGARELPAPGPLTRRVAALVPADPGAGA